MNATYPSPIPGICTDSEWTTKIITQSEIVRGWVRAYAEAVRRRQAVARDEASFAAFHATHPEVSYAVSERIVLGTACVRCNGRGLVWYAPDDIEECYGCGGTGIDGDAHAALFEEHEMADVNVCIEASEAAVAFGGYPEDLVTRVYACVGIEVPDWQGNPEVLDGCEACHYTGWTFHNGEPLDHCRKCKAGQALVIWSDTMDAADRKDCHY